MTKHSILVHVNTVVWEVLTLYLHIIEASKTSGPKMLGYLKEGQGSLVGVVGEKTERESSDGRWPSWSFGTCLEGNRC